MLEGDNLSGYSLAEPANFTRSTLRWHVRVLQSQIFLINSNWVEDSRGYYNKVILDCQLREQSLRPKDINRNIFAACSTRLTLFICIEGSVGGLEYLDLSLCIRRELSRSLWSIRGYFLKFDFPS